MNWVVPLQDFARRVQAPACANPACRASSWARWCHRNHGAYLNRRWFCSEVCIKAAMAPLVADLPRIPKSTSQSAFRLPLGLLLLSRGIIDEHELALALARKALNPSQRIGECMRGLSLVTEEDIARAIAVQSSLPLLLGCEPQSECLIPIRLQETAEAFCFQNVHNPSTVFVGFSSYPNPSLVKAVESILQVTADPCVVPASLVKNKLAQIQEREYPSEVVFDVRMSGEEIMNTVCSYARQGEVESIRMANTSEYIWARLYGRQVHDMLFRIYADN